ncbi:MAG: tRNA (N6-isopentenyl adenosine(37)-C2)-methylthiotransferase MiaB [Chloroflexi bacterium]|nr:tRNA (N6-isopentenyl adenosine(37)-C2)-methylthiotransferase MiaB [Chloroflexota bacterium]
MLVNKSEIESYHIWTVGCQMNVADSQRVDVGLNKLGLIKESNIENANIIVLNTCVVRQSAEDTATGLLGKLLKFKNNDKRYICVTGCMVESNTKNLSQRFPQVDLWAKPQETSKIIENIADYLNLSSEGCVENLIPKRSNYTEFVPIVQGCDKFCTFCVIPYRRGREVSRTIDEIIFEIETLANNGTLEVTLLGQNVDSYGHDLNPKVDLSDLLIEVEKIPMIKRIRFLTSHPNDMSIKLLETIGSLDKICESVNLPFQSGSDRILANMRRGYTRDQYLSKIDQIKLILPNSTITTDLIVGFPGEKEEDFEDSIDILKKVKFDKVHVAAYSERKGTYAFRKIDDNIPVNIKRLRLNKVNRLQEEIQLELNNKYLNSVYKILIDGKTKDRFYGRTLGDKLVYIKDINASDLGSIIETEINEVSPYSLSGSKI